MWCGCKEHDGVFWSVSLFGGLQPGKPGVDHNEKCRSLAEGPAAFGWEKTISSVCAVMWPHAALA